jgi:hypothetical protein
VYKEPPSVMLSYEGYGEFVMGYRNVTTTGMTIYFSLRDNAWWTSTWNVTYGLFGKKVQAFRLLSDDTGGS